ncbi:MAG: aldehyde dehydrogenase family protein [Phycisphaeraceae bacterium]|nr:aldehyde dehydrogenase family protein [Phycisphaeraceae bacterium]
MSKHPSLTRESSARIGARWVPVPGETLRSWSPASPGKLVWAGSPELSHVGAAVDAARGAATEWSRWGFERRAAVLRRFAQIAKERAEALAVLISDEVGKVMWDARAEAGLIAGKVEITLDEAPGSALTRVRGWELSLGPGKAGRCEFKPHGVMAVLGPFNFPAHLPNGHIVPALAMGNTVVFKPSDKTPGVGQALAEMLCDALDEAGAPPGVMNLVQGGADVASSLATHDDVNGVLFTGSWAVGRRIMRANLDRPGRILALEMGGNNPAVVMPDADLQQALAEVVRCAFITSGQRCTCTRRLIVHKDIAERFIPAVCKAASALIIGGPRDSHPVFMGPVISQAARDAFLLAQDCMRRGGGHSLVPMTAPPEREGWYITPGVMRVERFEREGEEDQITPGGSLAAGADVEVFGPFLRVCVVDSFDKAVEQANETRFGLAASIFTRDEGRALEFWHRVQAGCINWNTGTAGASSKLPFGGLGLSGNHRPAGAFSLDYCAYPVAGMQERGGASTVSPGMMIDPGWL